MDNNLVCNSLILAHCLRDNLDLMSEQIKIKGKLKIAVNQYKVQANQFLNSTYKKVSSDNLDWLNKEIDLTNEIIEKVSKMDYEAKLEFKNKLEKV